MKEFGDQWVIIILMHTKPILCDKARFYADPIFTDRLKRISPSLASVGKRMPTQAELEEAAFVRLELSVEIPRLNLELHRAKVERRVRPVQPDEPIDLSKLAIDLTTLPPVVSRDPPTQEDVNKLVDAFVAQLQWTDKVDDDISEKMSPVSEEGKGQRTEKRVDRSLVDREREERDV